MKTTLKILVLLLLGSTVLQAQSLPEMITVNGGTFTMGDELGIGQDEE